MPATIGTGAGQAYISTPLANAMATYDQTLEDFAWQAMFPRIETAKPSGKYPEFPAGDWARPIGGPRGNLDEVKTGGFSVNWKDFSTELFAVGSDIGQHDMNGSEPSFKLKVNKAKFVLKQLHLLLEAKWASAYFTTAGVGGDAWTTTRVGVTSGEVAGTSVRRWDDPGSSPIRDVVQLKRAIHLASGGFMPNAGVIDGRVFDSLLTHAEIVERVKFTDDRAIQLDIVKRYFGLESLKICQAVYNAGKEGQSNSMAYVTGPNLMLAYVNPDAAFTQDTPSAGATAWWTGMEGSVNGFQAAEIPLPLKRGVRIEAQVGFQFKMLAPSLGGLITDLISV